MRQDRSTRPVRPTGAMGRRPGRPQRVIKASVTAGGVHRKWRRGPALQSANLRRISHAGGARRWL